MCGILGFVNFNGSPSKKILSSMLKITRHRGPDSEGAFVGNHIALGVNRLRIIDLTTGDQPIENEDKSLVVVFNGEIYNYLELRKKLQKLGHKFKTHSDTEVLLHLYEEYGHQFPSHLSGMFAFALWDKKTNSLFLARDHAGIKPLYNYQKGNFLVFASELKAILLHPKVKHQIDPQSLTTYLALGYIPGRNSFFQDIKKLEPGTTLLFSKSGTIKSRFWSLADQVNKNPTGSLNNILNTAVNAQTVADVPWGLFLSGGLDSSLLAYYLSKSKKRLKTFALGFTESDFDESGFAKQVAKHFQTDHREEMFGADDLLSSFSDITSQLDEPFGDPSMFPTYQLSKLAKKYVTVALSGDGGDELFGGYPTYRGHLYARLFNLFPPSTYNVLKQLSIFYPLSFGAYNKSEIYIRFFNGLKQKGFKRHLSWNPQTNQELALPDLSELTALVPAKAPTVLKYQMFDFLTYLEGDLLVKTDRASMLNSLEVRVPYLDPKVMAFAFSASKNHVDYFETKKLLRKLAKNKLPGEIIARKKKGFGLPLARWMQEELKDLVGDLIFSKNLQTFVDSNVIKNSWSNYKRTGQNYHTIWNLVMLSAWSGSRFNV